MVNTEVDLGFLKLKNPIITASGTFGYGLEFKDLIDLNLLGGIVLKGIYNNEREGNEPPRIYESSSGILNSVGLPGIGKVKLKDVIKELSELTSTPIIVNVCGEEYSEYVEVAGFFDDDKNVDALELNISCPNVHEGGKCPAQDKEHTFRLVKEIKDKVKKPVIVKLSPNVCDISEIAQSAERAGADAISLVNTFLGIAIDVKRKGFVFKNIVAGYSGPAIKPLALKLVWEVVNTVDIPVIGIGGITSGEDVLEFIYAGAHAVQIGSINLVEPSAGKRILNELSDLMQSLKIKKLEEVRGIVNKNLYE